MIKEIGDVAGKHIALVGDLLHGRTIHSLLHLLSVYRGVSVELISPPALRLPSELLHYFRAQGLTISESESFGASTYGSDVLYITRVQRERFANPRDYEAATGSYFVDASVMARMKPESILLHALPRLHEIDPGVDNDPRAAYFRQARNGMYIRMALLASLLS
jgi:aspartate carbamoyltransferase catalytic subunit